MNIGGNTIQPITMGFHVLFIFAYLTPSLMPGLCLKSKVFNNICLIGLTISAIFRADANQTEHGSYTLFFPERWKHQEARKSLKIEQIPLMLRNLNVVIGGFDDDMHLSRTARGLHGPCTSSSL